MINEELQSLSIVPSRTQTGPLDALSCALESDDSLNDLWRFRLWSKLQDLIQIDLAVRRSQRFSNSLHDRMESVFLSLQSEMERAECSTRYKAQLWQWWSSYAARRDALQPVIDPIVSNAKDHKYIRMLVFASGVTVLLILFVIFVNYM